VQVVCLIIWSFIFCMGVPKLARANAPQKQKKILDTMSPEAIRRVYSQATLNSKAIQRKRKIIRDGFDPFGFKSAKRIRLQSLVTISKARFRLEDGRQSFLDSFPLSMEDAEHVYASSLETLVFIESFMRKNTGVKSYSVKEKKDFLLQCKLASMLFAPVPKIEESCDNFRDAFFALAPLSELHREAYDYLIESERKEKNYWIKYLVLGIATAPFIFSKAVWAAKGISVTLKIIWTAVGAAIGGVNGGLIASHLGSSKSDDALEVEELGKYLLSKAKTRLDRFMFYYKELKKHDDEKFGRLKKKIERHLESQRAQISEYLAPKINRPLNSFDLYWALIQ